MSTTTAYILAGAFEFVGAAWVVIDLCCDRERARKIVANRGSMPRSPGRRAWVYEGLENRTGGPGSASYYRAVMQRRKRTWSEVQRGVRRAAVVEAEVLDILRGSLIRRLGGAAFVVVGIAIGTAANIASTH